MATSKKTSNLGEPITPSEDKGLKNAAGNVSSGSASSSKTTSTSTKSSSSSSSKSSGSAASKAATVVDTGPSYANQFYNAMENGVSSAQVLDASFGAEAADKVNKNAKAYVAQSEVERVQPVDIVPQVSALRRGSELAAQEARLTADRATEAGVAALRDNQTEANAGFQTQRDQIAADEQKALDNQVLYAEARGDRGGIGQTQYGGIQNTAANNRRAVNSAQVQLASDTNRQIADLRAKGEYEKADKVLQISQNYLSQLINLENWADEQNVGIDEFNSKIAEWENEYRLSVGKYLTDTELKAAEAAGTFPNGAMTQQAKDAKYDRYANSGKAMMSAGIVPSEEQLSSMGWTPEQYWIWRMANASA